MIPAPPVASWRCRRCKHAARVPDNHGNAEGRLECRRFPPVAPRGPDRYGNPPTPLFPVMHPDEWCWEFQPWPIHEAT